MKNRFFKFILLDAQTKPQYFGQCQLMTAHLVKDLSWFSIRWLLLLTLLLQRVLQGRFSVFFVQIGSYMTCPSIMFYCSFWFTLSFQLLRFSCPRRVRDAFLLLLSFISLISVLSVFLSMCREIFRNYLVLNLFTSPLNLNMISRSR